MRTLAPLAAALLAVAMNAGCMSVLCGPPSYGLVGVSATVTFTEAWNESQALDGLRAAGFEGAAKAERVVSGGNATLTMSVTGGPEGTRVSLLYGVQERGTSQDEMERAGDAFIESQRAEAERMLAAFEAGSGWSRDTSVEWGKGVLHGDC